MMKRPKLLGLIAIAGITFISVIFIAYLARTGLNQFSNAGESRLQGDFQTVLSTPFTETCLDPTSEYRPTWECYEVSASVPAYTEVVIRHSEGDEHRVLTFADRGQSKFRFTPTKPGQWSFSTGGEVEIQAERPTYAKGFVAAGDNQKWIRTATDEAFVPQFVMYDKPTLDEGLEEFIEGHGFTGFHIQNLRDFMENPSYFEAAVLKTYRRGGVTHFWIWGDKGREQSPDTYGINVDKLYKEMAARLGPLPGWTYSYGFDLFEWASAEELEDFRDLMNGYTTYTHLFGGRGHKRRYKEISSNLDYAAWEWHRPSYEDYRDHLKQANGRPAFSEDRFRIRTPSRYPEKDYDPELTRQGLWYSMLSGGVANIWGNKPEGASFSEPYPNKTQLKTYSTFASKFYTKELQPNNDLIESGYCLSDGQTQAVCYAEDTAEVNLQLANFAQPVSIIAVDAKQAYQEITLTQENSDSAWTLPYASDWALALVQ
jgi:hypothetical protein